MQELEQLYLEYSNLLNRLTFDPKDLDYSILSSHVTTLKFLEEFTGNYYEIFDLYKREHLYFTKSFMEHFGFENDDEFDNHIHPVDFIQLMKLGNYFMKFVLDSDVSERKNYKLCNEFRIKNKDGEYVRVQKQFRLLEMDKKGNLWLSLGTLSPAPDNEPNTPVRSRLVHLPSGKTTVYRIEDTIVTHDTPLSEREIQILGLIAKGNPSKQIAEKLFLSNSTVNTHRQNIIRKLGVQNTVEAVQIALNQKLISNSEC